MIEYRFRVHQGGQKVAEGWYHDQQQALDAGRHYFMQYSEDGPARLELHRREVRPGFGPTNWERIGMEAVLR